jgi:hypothetical protein
MESIESVSPIKSIIELINNKTYDDILHICNAIIPKLKKKRISYYDNKFKKDMFVKMEYDEKYTELINTSNITNIVSDDVYDPYAEDGSISNIIRINFGIDPIFAMIITRKSEHYDSHYNVTIHSKPVMWTYPHYSKKVSLIIYDNKDHVSRNISQCDILIIYDDIKHKINLNIDDFTKFINQSVCEFGELRCLNEFQ